MGFPSGSEDKESACNAGDLGSVPGLRVSPGGEHGKDTPVSLPGGKTQHSQKQISKMKKRERMCLSGSLEGRVGWDRASVFDSL